MTWVWNAARDIRINLNLVDTLTYHKMESGRYMVSGYVREYRYAIKDFDTLEEAKEYMEHIEKIEGY